MAQNIGSTGPAGPPTALSSLTVAGVPIISSGTLPVSGYYWFVSSTTGSDGFPGTFTAPYATVGQALNQTVAGRGDVIVLLQNHAETVSAAGGITMATSGVTIIGLGNGNDRPLWTFATSVSASCLVTAANCAIYNIVGISGIDQLTQPFDIRAAGFTGVIEWQDSASNVEAVRAVLTNASADRLNLTLKYLGQTGGTHCVNGVRLVGTDGAIITTDFYGKASTAWVEFVTTACTNIEVYGYMYNSGTTNGTKDVVDTVTGSTWFATFYDGSAGSSFSGGSAAALAADDISVVVTNQAVPTADSTANVLSRDVVGNKTDATVQTVGTTASELAYTKGLLNALTGAGITSYPVAAAPGNNVTVAAALSEVYSQAERVVSTTTAAVMAQTTTTIFTVAGGGIQILDLLSVCVTTNNANAATLQYVFAGTLGSSTTISGATASLASLVAGDNVMINMTALATAPDIMSTGTGAALGPVITRGIYTNGAGNIRITIGTAATTGTWNHVLRYRPLARGVTVTAAF